MVYHGQLRSHDHTMSTLRAYLGTAGLTDVGYRFYTQNTRLCHDRN